MKPALKGYFLSGHKARFRHNLCSATCQRLPEAKGEKDFTVYENLKAKLVYLGIPENEIQFIQHFQTSKAKQRLFSDVRSGKVRVLIGSTGMMGTGMNVQHKLIALHHLDCPNRPSDIEQREGRIIRQGNENPTVQIYYYYQRHL